jgi:hypothetical protein
MTLGRAGRPASLTNSQTKVKAFNAIANHFLSPWLQRYQHGSTTSVKSHFLLPIPKWVYKPVTVHAMPGTALPLIPLEAEYDKCRTPKFPGLGLIHSPSTHLDSASTNRRSTKK